MASRTRNTPVEVRRRTAVPVSEPAKSWNWLLLFAGALALTFLAFGPSLDGVFVFDDFHLPFADAHAGEMPARFWIGGVRPILIATYWANFLISGKHPFSYHLVNLLLHAGTGVLVFFILNRLLEISGLKDGRRRWYALFGAALFLLHPLQTESVDYVAGRSELVAGILFFASWWVFLRSFESATRVGTAIGVLLLAGAAVLGKESAICLPAILIATDLFWAQEGVVAQFRKRLKLYIPFVLGGIAGAFLILRTLTTGGAGTAAGVSPLSYALTQCKVILIYIRLFFVPLGQNGDWQLPFFHSLGAGGAWIYVVALGSLCAAIVWLYKRDRLAAFGLLVFLLMLAPTSSVVPIKDALAERRMYAPMVGLILTVLALSLRLSVSRDSMRIAAAGVLVVCGVLSWERSEIWVSDVTFWQDSAAKNPANFRAYYGLGVALMKQGNCPRAVSAFSTARAMQPSDMQIAFDLATAYQCDKQPGRAVPILRTIVATQPSPGAYDLIGYLEAIQGHPPEALEALNNALRMDPNNAVAYAYRGLTKLALKQDEAAAADFARALEIDPNNGTASNGLAVLAGQR